MFSEKDDNVDLVLGVKNFVGLEWEISMREPNFKLFNRAVPNLPVQIEII